MPVDFDDMTKRIIDKLDILDDKIDKLCVWKTEMEVEWKNHMKELDDRSKGKEKKFYYVIAAMGIIFTATQILQGVL